MDMFYRNAMLAATARWPLSNSRLLRRPVELLFYRFLFEAGALQQTLHILGHLRVAAEVRSRVGAGESGGVQVLAGDVFGASAFAGPMRVQPVAADRGGGFATRV